MKISKFRLGILIVILGVVAFFAIPSIMPMIADFQKSLQPTTVDASEKFPSLDKYNGASLVGQFTTERVYQTVYTRGIKYCNTYTLRDKLELVSEKNGLSQIGSHEINQTKPIAVTCMVESDVVKGLEKDTEALAFIAKYDSETGTYSIVKS